MDNSTDIQTLTRLIETTLDNADGYEEAAMGTRSRALNAMLRERSEARRTVAMMLQECVRELGGEPDEESMALARAHRVLLHVDGSPHDSGAILEQVRRDEAYIKAEFESAIRHAPVSTRTLRTIADARTRICHGQRAAPPANRVLHG